MVYVLDIGKLELGSEVTVTGYVAHCRKHRDSLSVWLRDITGGILVRLPRGQSGEDDPWPKSLFSVGERIAVTGSVDEGRDGGRILHQVSGVQQLGRVHNKLSELDAEMREQASRMLLSRAFASLSTALHKLRFTEFYSRVLSLGSQEPGLEPLKAIYPGFGSPVRLVTSPSAQVMDYLGTTGEKRAFTKSISFSTTFRFPNGSAEIPVVVGKALDLEADELQALLSRLSTRVLDTLEIDAPTVSSGDGVSSPTSLWGWPEPDLIETDDRRVHLLRFRVSIPVFGKQWQSTIRTIIHLCDSAGRRLAEGAIEELGTQVRISTLTFYPSQYLEGLKSRPGRLLRDLESISVWEDETQQ